ncbi:MAG: hypothetical protein ACYDEX_00055 [Mobilitalea sp.]
MSRRKKVIRNLILLIILFFIFFNQFGLYFTPMSAHENSERGIHYGPSEVVHIEDFKEGKYLLCKYDNYVSCNTVNKSFIFFWRIGNQPIGFENNKTKPLNFTWNSSFSNWKVYGIVNDARIKRVEIVLNDGNTFTQSEFYDDLFLFIWDTDDNFSKGYKIIKGYDADNTVIYEEEY